MFQNGEAEVLANGCSTRAEMRAGMSARNYLCILMNCTTRLGSENACLWPT
jgi:hypothetical protein